jgi:hypothetical protein
VNKGLERLTKQQSIEIKSLRKQLRQSIRLSAAGPRSISPEEESSEDDLSDEDSDDNTEKHTGDIDLDIRLGLDKSIFLTEQMLAEGRRGLEYRVRTSELPLGGRVLDDSD